MYTANTNYVKSASRARIEQPPPDLVAQLNSLGVPIRRVNHNLG